MSKFNLTPVVRTYTTQKQLRREFWQTFPELPAYVGSDGDWPVDTRCAFVDWIDSLQKDGQISEALAERVTL